MKEVIEDNSLVALTIDPVTDELFTNEDLPAVGIPLEGIRLGLNGKEIEIGQAVNHFPGTAFIEMNFNLRESVTESGE